MTYNWGVTPEKTTQNHVVISLIISSMKKLKITRAAYDVARRLMQEAGPMPAMAGISASQKANECETA